MESKQNKRISYEDLQNVLDHTRTPRNKLKTSNYDYSEVYPDIYVGDWNTAQNLKLLTSLGITHVVNAAEGYGFNSDDKNEFYRPVNITYMGLSLTEDPNVEINEYYNPVSDFIDGALLQKGKVLIHCVMGISRSATITIAYLMIKKRLRAKEAIEKVKKARDIEPSEGFLQHLAQLDYYLFIN